ncbi:hypothetical protein CWI39_3693p0010 [Hamiltosporidium magnivora]|uniref:CobQ/CobB/MinD/ParA nucleotide binding domain-containing protein n=1 Tax=Hamiltosporidium magnivora TaxID=148818 RepID=A0A4Q9KRD6_9MICR|nr:hypothetical protein CWI39_3693p0010 [Hamiltosporidium magnivora]
MSNSKNPKIISFVTTKGGAGKTTISLALCSHINYYCTDKNILYYDMDLGTKSSFLQRKDDLEFLNSCLEQYPNIKISKMFSELKEANSIYPIDLLKGDELHKSIRNLPKNYYDLIYLDTPGSFEAQEWIASMSILDYIFIPCKSDLFSIRSAMNSYNTIFKLKKSKQMPNLKYFSLILLDIEPHHNINNIIEEIDLLNETNDEVQILNTIIPHRKELNDKKCISIIPIAPYDKAHYLKELYEEINQIINI